MNLKAFCLIAAHAHRIIHAQSSPGLWVKSQGSEVITPTQTSVSGQIMRGSKFSMLRCSGRGEVNPLTTAECMCVCTHMRVSGGFEPCSCGVAARFFSPLMVPMLSQAGDQRGLQEVRPLIV